MVLVEADKIRINRGKVEDPFLRIYGSDKYKNIHSYGLVDFPFIIDVETTNYCFLNCIMCNRQLMKRPIGYMTFEAFRKIADEVAKHKDSSIRFSGWGEPTMNKDIVKFIEYAHKKGILTHLTTNGFNLEEDFIRSLLKAGVNKIKISMQGATKEEYEKMRDNQRYNELVRKIKRIVDIRNEMSPKTFIQASTSVTDETPEQIKEFLDKWTKIVDGVFGVGKESNYLTSFARIRHLDKIKNLNVKASRVRKPGTKCMEIRTKLSVAWNGNIKACCSDYDDFLLLGNIHDMTLEEAWKGEKMNDLRRGIESRDPRQLPDFCNGCDTLF